MNDEVKIILEQVTRALFLLQEVCEETETVHDIIVDATIYRYRFAFDMLVKLLDKYLKQDFGAEVYGPKKVLEQAYVNGLINNEKLWIDMLADRNRTSHIYKEEMADEIYARIKTYVPEMRKAYNQLIKEFS